MALTSGIPPRNMFLDRSNLSQAIFVYNCRSSNDHFYQMILNSDQPFQRRRVLMFP